MCHFVSITGRRMFENNTTSNTSVTPVTSYANYPQWAHLAICVVSILCCIVGVVGNTFVILSVVIYNEMRAITNYLVVNLAVCDTMLIVLTLPQQVAYHLDTRKLCLFCQRRCY